MLSIALDYHQHISTLPAMKAIKIPNTALLDVYGRPVAVNSHDLHRPSIMSYQSDKNALNNQSDPRNKNITASASLTKSEQSERLTVIGNYIKFFLSVLS